MVRFLVMISELARISFGSHVFANAQGPVVRKPINLIQD